MSKRSLNVEPEFMKATREAEEDRLLALALYLNHRIVLSKHQRIRARLRADKLIEERRASRRED